MNLKQADGKALAALARKQKTAQNQEREQRRKRKKVCLTKQKSISQLFTGSKKNSTLVKDAPALSSIAPHPPKVQNLGGAGVNGGYKESVKDAKTLAEKKNVKTKQQEIPEQQQQKEPKRSRGAQKQPPAVFGSVAQEILQHNLHLPHPTPTPAIPSPPPHPPRSSAPSPPQKDDLGGSGGKEGKEKELMKETKVKSGQLSWRRQTSWEQEEKVNGISFQRFKNYLLPRIYVTELDLYIGRCFLRGRLSNGTTIVVRLTDTSPFFYIRLNNKENETSFQKEFWDFVENKMIENRKWTELLAIPVRSPLEFVKRSPLIGYTSPEKKLTLAKIPCQTVKMRELFRDLLVENKFAIDKRIFLKNRFSSGHRPPEAGERPRGVGGSGGEKRKVDIGEKEVGGEKKEALRENDVDGNGEQKHKLRIREIKNRHEATETFNPDFAAETEMQAKQDWVLNTLNSELREVLHSDIKWRDSLIADIQSPENIQRLKDLISRPNPPTPHSTPPTPRGLQDDALSSKLALKFQVPGWIILYHWVKVPAKERLFTSNLEVRAKWTSILPANELAEILKWVEPPYVAVSMTASFSGDGWHESHKDLLVLDTPKEKRDCFAVCLTSYVWPNHVPFWETVLILGKDPSSSSCSSFSSSSSTSSFHREIRFFATPSEFLKAWRENFLLNDPDGVLTFDGINYVLPFLLQLDAQHNSKDPLACRISSVLQHHVPSHLDKLLSCQSADPNIPSPLPPTPQGFSKTSGGAGGVGGIGGIGGYNCGGIRLDLGTIPGMQNDSRIHGRQHFDFLLLAKKYYYSAAGNPEPPRWDLSTLSHSIAKETSGGMGDREEKESERECEEDEGQQKEEDLLLWILSQTQAKKQEIKIEKKNKVKKPEKKKKTQKETKKQTTTATTTTPTAIPPFTPSPTPRPPEVVERLGAGRKAIEDLADRLSKRCRRVESLLHDTELVSFCTQLMQATNSTLHQVVTSGKKELLFQCLFYEIGQEKKYINYDASVTSLARSRKTVRGGHLIPIDQQLTYNIGAMYDIAGAYPTGFVQFCLGYSALVTTREQFTDAMHDGLLLNAIPIQDHLGGAGERGRVHWNHFVQQKPEHLCPFVKMISKFLKNREIEKRIEKEQKEQQQKGRLKKQLIWKLLSNSVAGLLQDTSLPPEVGIMKKFWPIHYTALGESVTASARVLLSMAEEYLKSQKAEILGGVTDSLFVLLPPLSASSLEDGKIKKTWETQWESYLEENSEIAKLEILRKQQKIDDEILHRYSELAKSLSEHISTVVLRRKFKFEFEGLIFGFLGVRDPHYACLLINERVKKSFSCSSSFAPSSTSASSTTSSSSSHPSASFAICFSPPPPPPEVFDDLGGSGGVAGKRNEGVTKKEDNNLSFQTSIKSRGLKGKGWPEFTNSSIDKILSILFEYHSEKEKAFGIAGMIFCPEAFVDLQTLRLEAIYKLVNENSLLLATSISTIPLDSLVLQQKLKFKPNKHLRQVSVQKGQQKKAKSFSHENARYGERIRFFKIGSSNTGNSLHTLIETASGVKEEDYAQMQNNGGSKLKDQDFIPEHRMKRSGKLLPEKLDGQFYLLKKYLPPVCRMLSPGGSEKFLFDVDTLEEAFKQAFSLAKQETARSTGQRSIMEFGIGK